MFKAKYPRIIELPSLKILLVIDRLTNPHAGTEGQFLLLINQLMQVGVQVQVIVLAGSDWLTRNGLPCPYELVGSSSVKLPRTWIRLYQLGRRFKREGFGLAHVFFNDASVICPPVFRAVGIKTIISRRDMGFWYNKLYRFLLPVTGRCVDMVISNSQAVSEVTRQVEKIPPANLKVIYNGFNRVAVSAEPVAELKKLASQGAVIFGLVANIRPIKRIQDAIEALSRLPDTMANAHLVVIGAGDAQPLTQLASKLGVGDRVHFLGSRSDIPECLQYFSAGLICSESEGFSNSIVEYQFAGLPVICTRTGGNPEAVEDGVTGWLYPVADVAALTQAFINLLSDPTKAKAMGIRAKTIATERYTIDNMRENHLRLYHQLIGL